MHCVKLVNECSTTVKNQLKAASGITTTMYGEVTQPYHYKDTSQSNWWTVGISLKEQIWTEAWI